MNLEEVGQIVTDKVIFLPLNLSGGYTLSEGPIGSLSEGAFNLRRKK